MSRAFEQLSERLLPWYETNRRDLPWRRDREPYHVFLSEVMLQQTRVETVKSYYARFIEVIPTLKSLANADEAVIQKLWEGLGYYSRARNLQKGAREVMERHGGRFPETYDEVRALSGVGDYTAGAIASICFERPTPAVDGNVMRLAARLTENPGDVRNAKLRRLVREQLAAVYPDGHCGDFTQALMELGATVCVPNGAPNCASCPICDLCRAGKNGTWRQFPSRVAKRARRVEEWTVFLLSCGSEIAVRRREDAGLLRGLWELPNVPGKLSAQQAIFCAEAWGIHPLELKRAVEKKHIFTHVEWRMRCYELDCAAKSPQFFWASVKALDQEIALPTAFRIVLDKKGGSSNG